MLKRIVIGTALLLALAGIALIDRQIGRPILSVLVILGMTLQAQRELFNISGVGFKAPMLLAQLATIGAFLARWVAYDGNLGMANGEFLVLSVVGLSLASLVWATLTLQKTGEEEPRLMHAAILAVFAFVYLGIPMGFLQLIAMSESVAFAALMVLVSKCGDMGGYLVGSKIGKHRVMPRVSPKKSWEGSVGGLLLTLLVLFWARQSGAGWLPAQSVLQVLVFGLLMNLATQAGDFAESMMKRCFKVKDSADLLPTFGGALDILDSLVFSMPVAALFTILVR